jgi:hemoglobin/transferrin/lactoferrin receptor protein
VKSFKRFMKLDAAAYYTLIDDAMERMNYTFNGQSTILYEGNNSTVQAVQNVTKAYVYGLQAGVDLFYKGIGLKSTFSYQHGKEQSGDSLVYYPLRHAAPAFGGTHLTYQMKRFKFDFYVVYNGRMDFEDLALTERVNASYARDYSIDPKGLPYSAGWYTLNFKMAYYPTNTLAITTGVENIADLLYRPYSSGINAPGRNFMLAVKYRIPQPRSSQKLTVKGL